MNQWDPTMIEYQIERIMAFIRGYVREPETIVVPVSGGLDSDVVARLCCRSLGKTRVRLFIVIESDMESHFLRYARELAEDLNLPLAEIHLEHMNTELIQALEQGEQGQIFDGAFLLNVAKAKCAVRSAVICSYQDKGFVVAGTTNRSEKELGFFLTFGDNLANLKPIAHLYKTEVKQMAKALGTKPEVLNQDPSAGFWEGQTDLEDIAYWIINDGPIVMPRRFSEKEVLRAEQIREKLDQGCLDETLRLYGCGAETSDISTQTGLSEEIVIGICHIVEKAKYLKNRPILVELSEKCEIQCCTEN